MTKREMIDEILAINISAKPQFLARFDDDDLLDYLTHLRVLSTPRLSGEAGRYDKYFRNLPKLGTPRPRWRQENAPVEGVAAGQADDDCQAESEAEPAASGDQRGLFDQPQSSIETEDAAETKLGAEDVDLAVGQEERDRLLDASATVDDSGDDDNDEQEQAEAFRLSPPARQKSSSRAASSTVARPTPYGLDASQTPPRPRSRPKVHAHAAVAANGTIEAI